MHTHTHMLSQFSWLCHSTIFITFTDEKTEAQRTSIISHNPEASSGDSSVEGLALESIYTKLPLQTMETLYCIAGEIWKAWNNFYRFQTLNQKHLENSETLNRFCVFIWYFIWCFSNVTIPWRPHVTYDFMQTSAIPHSTCAVCCSMPQVLSHQAVHRIQVVSALM